MNHCTVLLPASSLHFRYLPYLGRSRRSGNRTLPVMSYRCPSVIQCPWLSDGVEKGPDEPVSSAHFTYLLKAWRVGD